MPLKRPLTGWDQVDRTIVDPAGPTLRFSVTDDGMWTEEVTTLLPVPPETGQLKKWELRVLDALVDQINREPIPDQTQWVGPARDESVGVYLDLDNGPTSYRLLSEDRAGRSVRANDKWDRLEIAALDTFMDYLETKYGTVSGDSIIG